jgi:hypothetical protein
MKIYRGPSSKPFQDDTHEYVSQILPDQLAEGISSSARIRFNITKDGYERQAVCTALFEEQDIIPMIGGLLARLKMSQECIAAIRSALSEKDLSDAQRLLKVHVALKALA